MDGMAKVAGELNGRKIPVILKTYSVTAAESARVAWVGIKRGSAGRISGINPEALVVVPGPKAIE